MDGRSLELRQVRQIETAIERATRHDHAARLQRLVIADAQHIASAVRVRATAQLVRLIRYRHFRTEFLRLVVGARHQRHARDAGGESEIVLDARGGAGLPAEGAAIEHDHRQPLRRRIDGGSQSRRSGADDRHVIDLRRVDRPHQADAARQLVLAGIAQRLAVGAEHDGQMVRIDVKALDQGLGAGIAIGIEHAMRLTVTGEKSLQAQDVGMIGASDDGRPARAGFQQADAAQDQRPHDVLAELGLPHQDIAQPVGGNDERLDRLHGHGIHQRGTGGELCQLASELSRPVRHDGFAPVEPAALRHLHLAGENDDQPGRHLARLHDALASGIGSGLAEAAQAIYLGRRQRGKHLVVPGRDERMRGLGHDHLQRRTKGPFEQILVTELIAIRD